MVDDTAYSHCSTPPPVRLLVEFHLFNKKTKNKEGKREAKNEKRKTRKKNQPAESAYRAWGRHNSARADDGRNVAEIFSR